MKFELPELPYLKNALEPHISAETLEYHHGKHHKAYVTKLNELIKDTKFENLDLLNIIRMAEGPLYNNAAQHWNHSFFWNCLSPKSTGFPGGKVNELIAKKWGSFDKFKEAFAASAINNFGSGWTWLSLDEKKELAIFSTSNADNPLKHGHTALLALDIWEHAYYIDYRNERADFISAFWKIINWEFVNKNLG